MDGTVTLLRDHGYADIILLTGHLHEQIEAVVGDGSLWGVQVRYQRDIIDGLGPFNAILWAQSHIGLPFFTLYGDSYLKCDYDSIEATFRISKRDALFTMYEGVDYGLRAFRRYPPRDAQLYEMPNRFMEIGSHAGLNQLRAYLSERNESIVSID